MTRPITITSLSSSGTGKTTNFANIAYCLGSMGYRVKIIELDSRNSLKTAMGMEVVERDRSTSILFDPDFNGDYPWQYAWKTYVKDRVGVCQVNRRAQMDTEKEITQKSEVNHNSLKNILDKHPVEADLLILDCGGQQGAITDAAIVAADCLLLGIEPTQKCFEDVGFFLEHLYSLDCSPAELPTLLGFLVGKFNLDGAYQREAIRQLYQEALKLDVYLFNPIRYSPHFQTTYALGVPLQTHLPSSGGTKDFLLEGNFFRRQHKLLKEFDSRYKYLPAIAPFLRDLISRKS